MHRTTPPDPPVSRGNTASPLTQLLSLEDMTAEMYASLRRNGENLPGLLASYDPRLSSLRRLGQDLGFATAATTAGPGSQAEGGADADADASSYGSDGNGGAENTEDDDKSGGGDGDGEARLSPGLHFVGGKSGREHGYFKSWAELQKHEKTCPFPNGCQPWCRNDS